LPKSKQFMFILFYINNNLFTNSSHLASENIYIELTKQKAAVIALQIIFLQFI